MNRTMIALTVAGLLSATASVVAHHSFAAEYDINKKVTFQGPITKIEWTNPHSYFYIDVTDANGKVANWALESFPPGSLTRIGWTRKLINVGDVVTVTAYLSRDGSLRANAREFTLPNGRKLAAGAAQIDPAGDK